MTPGAKLGPYEIVALIGAGGMGEVYRARDTKLKRDVALKVLPEAFARDPDRMARFQREAEVLASLNHPNIAHLYGIEERALVMELAEGETLPCPLPVETAINYAKQIAEALEYAHERGVIHRDLKPANVKVTPEGTVKLLDFGLAKAIEDPSGSSDDPANLPTLTLGATRVGVILGTAAYMSPEQASGRKADRRADIWSFGAVLYEMLAGKRAFAGESVSDTLATVLKLDPDWDALPAETPASIRRLVRRCLTKDRKQRLQAIGEARIALENPGGTEVPLQAEARATRLAPAVAAVAALALAAAGGFALSRYTTTETPRPVVRFTLEPPPGYTFGRGADVALSPTGEKMAFSAVSVESARRALFLRDLRSTEARELQGPPAGRDIFFSPDGRSLAFWSEKQLMITDLEGGRPRAVRGAARISGGAGVGDSSWGRTGTFLFFSPSSDELALLPEIGGEPKLVTRSAGGDHVLYAPWFLPDGKRFLFYRRGLSSASGDGELMLGSTGDFATKVVAKTTGGAAYQEASGSFPGLLVFQRGPVLYAQRFDESRAVPEGDAVPLVSSLSDRNPAPRAAVSGEALAYWAGTSGLKRKLTWLDRNGKPLTTIGPEDYIYSFRVSPGGKQAVVEIVRNEGNEGQLWILDLERGTMTRLTQSDGWDYAPVWSPDGKQVAFARNAPSELGIIRRAADGSGADEMVYDYKDRVAVHVLQGWMPGRLLFSAQVGRPGSDLYSLDEPRAKEARPLAAEASPRRNAAIHPQSRWVAYESRESKEGFQIFLQEVGEAGTFVGPKVPVSTNGGSYPHWRSDGKELYYQALDGAVMAVPVNITNEVHLGRPVSLMRLTAEQSGTRYGFDVSPDGQRFLVAMPVSSEQGTITVVLNWRELMRGK